VATKRKPADSLPRFFDVCGTRVKIIRRSSKTDPELRNAWGYFNDAKATIVIDKKCKNDKAWWTLRHELAHAFLAYTGTMYCLQSVLNIKDMRVLEYIEEVLIREAFVPFGMSIGRGLKR
jgi:Zn-dependent peptidase ImmA (M78 family)